MKKEREEKGGSWDKTTVTGILLALFALNWIPIAYVFILFSTVTYAAYAALEWIFRNKEAKQEFEQAEKKIKRILRRRMENAVKKGGGKGDIAEDVAYMLQYSILEDDYKKRKQGNRDRGMSRMLSCGMILVCLFFVQNEYKDIAFAAMMNGLTSFTETLLGVNEELEECSESIDESEYSYEETVLTEAASPEPERLFEIIPLKYFVENPAEDIAIPEKLKKAVFYEGEDRLEYAVTRYFEQLLACGRLGKTVEGAVDSKGRDAGELSDLEKLQESSSAEAQQTGDYIEWAKLAPDIFELMDLIEGREEILEKRGNGRMSFLIANNYQRCALEYQGRADGNGNRILLYYMKSIYFAEQALSYENDSWTDRMDILTYIIARYRDIKDCKRIDITIQERAGEIERELKLFMIEDRRTDHV